MSNQNWSGEANETVQRSFRLDMETIKILEWCATRHKSSIAASLRYLIAKAGELEGYRRQGAKATTTPARVQRDYTREPGYDPDDNSMFQPDPPAARPSPVVYQEEEEEEEEEEDNSMFKPDPPPARIMLADVLTEEEDDGEDNSFK